MIIVLISGLAKAINQRLHLKARYSSAFLLVSSFLIFCSCSSPRTALVETVRHDTIYLSNIQYDSIYILQDKYTDRSKDTLLIKEINTEYRYKLLRDTIRIVQRDSIPYEVRITEVKEVRYIPPWCKWLSMTGAIALLLLVIKLSQKLKAFI